MIRRLWAFLLAALLALLSLAAPVRADSTRTVEAVNHTAFTLPHAKDTYLPWKQAQAPPLQLAGINLDGNIRDLQGISIFTNPRAQLNTLLTSLGSTVADYQPGNYTGTLNASAWLNSIGAAPSLAQASSPAQPTINADGSLTFDGIAQYMTMATTLVQPEVVIAVFKQIAFQNGNTILSGALNNSMNIYQSVTSPNINLYAGTSITANTNLAVGVYGIVAATFNGAGSLLQVNNTAATTGNAGAANGGGLTVGANGSPFSAYANTQFKEIIILNAVPSAAKLANILNLLNQIYHIYAPYASANDWLNELPTVAANDETYRLAANGR